MKIRTLTILLWAAVFVSMSRGLVAQQSPAPVLPKEPAPDTAGVEPFLTAWDKALNAHDPDAVMRLLADDQVTVNRVGRLFINKQVLAPFMRVLLQQHFTDLQFPPLRILCERSFSPDLVIVQALWPQLKTKMPPPWPQVDDMILTFVLKRNGDNWLAEEVDSHDVWAPPEP